MVITTKLQHVVFLTFERINPAIGISEAIGLPCAKKVAKRSPKILVQVSHHGPMEQPSRCLSKSIKFERLQEPFRQIVGRQRNYVRPCRRPSRYNICAPNKIRNDGRMLETGTRGHHQAFFPEVYYILYVIHAENW